MSKSTTVYRNRYLLERYSGWVLVAVFTLIPVLRWLYIVDISEELSSWYGIATAIGKFGALAGTMLYAINFVLAIRSKWLEPFFGGLNRVYTAHHVTGGLALIFICLHPLFIAIRHIDLSTLSSFTNAMYVLLPDRPVFSSITEFMESMSINFGSIGFFGLVVLLLFTFFFKLKYHIWLKIHKFLGLAFLFAGLHVVYVWSDVRNDLPLRLYLVTWIGFGLAAYVHRTILGNIFVRRYRYVVSRINSPKDNVTVIGFEPQKKRISFTAGQFIFVKFISGKLRGEAHPFSISSKQGEHDKELEIHVKNLGDYTARLKDVKFGDQALLEGAFGRFIPARYPGTKQVWIAGGIGVTPFISMAKSFATIEATQVDLFYSVETRTELLDEKLFSDVHEGFDAFNFHQFVVDDKKHVLSAEYLSSELGGLDDTVFFICGPPVMMKSIKHQLLRQGVKKSHIVSEEFKLYN